MARTLSSFDSHLSTVPARGTTCPCGSTELDGARLDHSGRAECCESYCSPDSCECRSDLAPSTSDEHAAWERLGSAGPCDLLDRLVDSGISEAAALEVYENRGLGGLAHRVQAAEIVTTQRVYPVTDDVMAQLEAVSEEPVAVACGCGRSHTRAGFLALPAPVAGDTMAGADGGTLLLRNCPCGSTRAVLATAEELLRACPEFSAHVDAWQAEAREHRELFGVLEELATAAHAESANDDHEEDWRDEARSNYYQDIAAGMHSRW